jgi:hypothetical protein
VQRLLATLLVVVAALSGCAGADVEGLSALCANQSAAATRQSGVDGDVGLGENEGFRSDRRRSAASSTAVARLPSGGHPVLAHPLGAPRLVPNSPIGPASISEIQIVLPSILYFAVGATYRLEFEHIISHLEERHIVVVSGTPSGDSTNFDSYWEYRPVNPGLNTISIVVQDETGITLASATSRGVVTAPPTESGGLAHLSIGDSITKAGGYSAIAVQCILGGRTVGIRTYDSGSINVEARGGWTLDRYMTRVGEIEGSDSPFVFPVDVEGERFRGNTSFWRKVVNSDPTGYHYDGFQAIAREWRADGAYAFNSDGYPNAPNVGDVIVDPTFSVQARWREFNGRTWDAVPPKLVDVSFAKYVERFSSAFEIATPTSISLMLGTVDFLTSFNESEWAEYKSHLDKLIASIRSWKLDVPIILIEPPNGGPPAEWSDKEITAAEFDTHMLDLASRLYAAYDTFEQRQNNVYVISFLGSVSEGEMADYVHPKMPGGHAQMAAWLAGVLSYLISEDKVHVSQ